MVSKKLWTRITESEGKGDLLKPSKNASKIMSFVHIKIKWGKGKKGGGVEITGGQKRKQKRGKGKLPER